MTNRNHIVLAKRRRPARTAILCILVGMTGVPAFAQTAESVGIRALGMGGAFVAVADDSSATWWNPAGIAAGPFIDLSLGRSTVEVDDAVPAWRQRVSWFALATPPLGISYYRFRITDIQPFDPTARASLDREDRRAEVPVSSLSASQLGVTLVQSLIPGVHAGATLKYVRGTFHAGPEESLASPDDLLDRGDALSGGETESRFDLDVGVLAVKGPLRLGARMRNVREPEFGPLRLPRQTRVAVAFDAEFVTGAPLTVALDSDVVTYATPSGPRRTVALGAEQWLRNKRLGVRAGGYVNTAGAKERAVTVGASAAVRAGFYVEGYAVRGGAADEHGWGIGARASF